MVWTGENRLIFVWDYDTGIGCVWDLRVPPYRPPPKAGWGDLFLKKESSYTVDPSPPIRGSDAQGFSPGLPG